MVIQVSGLRMPELRWGERRLRLDSFDFKENTVSFVDLLGFLLGNFEFRTHCQDFVRVVLSDAFSVNGLNGIEILKVLSSISRIVRRLPLR